VWKSNVSPKRGSLPERKEIKLHLLLKVFQSSERKDHLLIELEKSEKEVGEGDGQCKFSKKNECFNKGIPGPCDD